MGPGGIPDNAVQPGGERRTTLELTEIPEGKKQSLLHNVFAVLAIAKHLSGSSLKSRHAGCEEFVQLSGIHIDRENERSVDLRAGVALLFNSQVASLGRRLKCWLVYANLIARTSPIAGGVFNPLKFVRAEGGMVHAELATPRK
jgi:hypothetical protein